jgi:hypothetical protein
MVRSKKIVSQKRIFESLKVPDFDDGHLEISGRRQRLVVERLAGLKKSWQRDSAFFRLI